MRQSAKFLRMLAQKVTSIKPQNSAANITPKINHSSHIHSNTNKSCRQNIRIKWTEAVILF